MRLSEYLIEAVASRRSGKYSIDAKILRGLNKGMKWEECFELIDKSGMYSLETGQYVGLEDVVEKAHELGKPVYHKGLGGYIVDLYVATPSGGVYTIEFNKHGMRELKEYSVTDRNKLHWSFVKDSIMWDIDEILEDMINDILK